MRQGTATHFVHFNLTDYAIHDWQAALVVFDERYSDAADIPTSDEEDTADEARTMRSATTADKGKGKQKEVIKLPVGPSSLYKFIEGSDMAHCAYTHRPQLTMKMKWTRKTTTLMMTAEMTTLTTTKM